MKSVAIFAAVLAVAACKGKEAPSLDSIPKAAPAAAAPADTTMKMDTAMKMSDTTMKKGAADTKKAAPAPAPAAAPAPAPAAMAPATPAPAPVPVVHEMAMAGSVEEWKGTVKSVNYQTRHIVITSKDGVAHSFMVPANVPNLDKVVKGDQVTATYVESIAIYLQQKSAPPAAATMSEMTVSPSGLPVVDHVRVVEFSATVTAINTGTRTLTLKGPQGNVVTAHVNPDVQSFSSVKVGDHIVVRASEAVAVTVNKF